MAAVLPTLSPALSQGRGGRVPWVPIVLVMIALAYLTLFLFVPLFAVFFEALKKGWATYGRAITDPDAWSAIRLTLLATAIAVPANLVFGVAAAWAIAKFDFRGKSVLTA